MPASHIARALQPVVERLGARRMVGNLPPRVVRGGFELLQANQAGEVSVHMQHISLRSKKKPRAGGLGKVTGNVESR